MNVSGKISSPMALLRSGQMVGAQTFADYPIAPTADVEPPRTAMNFHRHCTIHSVGAFCAGDAAYFPFFLVANRRSVFHFSSDVLENRAVRYEGAW